MSTNGQPWQFSPVVPPVEAEVANWYAILTRARHERVIASRLTEYGTETFLPVITEVHRWSDRKRRVEVPLFSCYVFLKMHLTNQARYRVCNIDGVFSFVGTREGPIAIPEEQIEAVRTLITQHIQYSTYPFLKIGQRVRIRSGSLDGVEGILVGRNEHSTLVVSIDAIQRSLAVRIEGYEVEPI
jgi:transcription antitermination factor NusG